MNTIPPVNASTRLLFLAEIPNVALSHFELTMSLPSLPFWLLFFLIKLFFNIYNLTTSIYDIRN